MAKHIIQNLEEMKKLVGKEIGVSDYQPVTQEAVNMFADATLDHQWIHVNPERARRESPFRGPVAHGYFTLSLGPYLLGEIMAVKSKMGLNYGVNKLRFTSPVPIPSRVRLRVALMQVEEIEGGAQATYKFSFEVEGKEKPACVAEVIYREYF